MRMRAQLLGWGLVAVGLFLVGLLLDASWLRVFVKPLPVWALAGWILLRPARTTPLGRAVVVGLLLSSVGDVLLELEGLFLPGLVAFLLAHVSYLVGFSRSAPRLALPRALPFVAYAGLLVAVLWSGLGAMQVPVAAYAVTISAMMWRASVRVDDPPRVATVLGLCGAAVFAFSDTLIALDRFNEPIEGVRIPIIVTYWLGQLLIAASVEDP